MKILVVGSGGREHAIVKKLRESNKSVELFVAPGNAGMSKEATCVNIAATDIDKMVAFGKEEQIDLVVVAPDDPLVLGMVDAFEEAGIRAYGPSKGAAAIEGSKIFSKHLMKKYNIPTAAYEVFEDVDNALAYFEDYTSYPTVIKADGLALGKGVVIAQNKEEAVEAVKSMMLDNKFGESGKQIVVEEFLEGMEVSVLAFTDGKSIKTMISSMDHKRALDGDEGLNTGGMGVVAPNPYYTKEVEAIAMETIFRPTVEAMNAEGRTFKGTLYFGLMITQKGVYVIEYNCRFGDPEAQVCLPLLEGDLVDIFEAVIDERLEEVEVGIKDQEAACVIVASGGYPVAYEKGKIISGLNEDGGLDNALVFHAGTKMIEDQFATNGGRVLGFTTMGDSLQDALDQAYTALKGVSFEGMHYRTDIGKKAMNYGK